MDSTKTTPACVTRWEHEHVLEAVQRRLWTRLSFLLTPDERLGGRTPLEALHAGSLDPVLRVALAAVAESYVSNGQQHAWAIDVARSA